ncbi:MAG: Glycosyl transferase, family 4 [Candidatus Roizmanbacteria bacterium GW2011_GWA2_35_19]|uniref:Glycosyl transferase, family 4 n=1 Tax=Candidatus Roizmanbacteria bacterium GW2011_GWA2_35_19 TaxID=1618478 RepID=A0A0G0CCH1_9BACT|nr:MAG: Glycosyl transferase, family 4 [Candidatus Roizmanbacteria bacterium GW2011_GWA2_35_19]
MIGITVFLIAFILSSMLTVPTIYLARKLKLVTNKKLRFHPAHTHEGIIPRAGGVPIYFSILLTSLLFLPFSKIMVGILFASFLLVLIGVFDDYSDVSPYLRFAANLVISGIVIGFGLGIPYISNPLGGVIPLDSWQIPIVFFGIHTIWVWADLLAVIWLSWTTNMVNWSKGVDGQLPGFVGITAIFLGLLSQRFIGHDISITSVSLFSFIIAGAYLGFLPFNFYPQKIMPGYGGGGLAGFLLGVLSIDWGHFHHRLLEIGWGKRRIAIFYWLISLILGISSLFLKGIEKLIAFITIALLLLIFIYIIEEMKKQNTN